jgi:DNA-binding transcriptional regulator GbsR (MarR family)
MMSPYVQRFVMHIGEMGSRWGLNRTLGQMCGLLYKELLDPRRKNDSTEATST